MIIGVLWQLMRRLAHMVKSPLFSVWEQKIIYVGKFWVRCICHFSYLHNDTPIKCVIA